jgi:hypothetical protein
MLTRLLRSRNVANASGVIAIIALTLAFIPQLAVLGSGGVALILLAVPVGICAIVLGAVGLFRGHRLGGVGVPMAILGVAGGLVAAAGSMVWLFSPGCSCI